MADPRIEGASHEQLDLLREVLAGLGSTRITDILVREFDPGFEGDLPPPPGPYGDEVAIATAPEDHRGAWEAGLLARSFAHRSQSAGLTKVAWFSHGGGGTTLEYVPPAAAPLDEETIARVRADVERSVADATVERFELLRPQGHAFAIEVRVIEPHAFLRSHARPFLTALGTWRTQADGVFAQVCDADFAPVLTVGWYQNGGFSSTRRDVECCAPFLGLSRGIMSPDPPPCPIFD